MGKSPSAEHAIILPAGSAKKIIASAWYGATLLRATALLGMVASYVTALWALFRKFKVDPSDLRQEQPWLFWLIILLPVVFIFIFSVGPECWSRYWTLRRNRMALNVDLTVPITSYFRLAPISDSPDIFQRADGAHERILRWIVSSQSPLLFVSGLSGTGKSSILEGYALPKLQGAGWRVEMVRSFDDPLTGLEGILASPQAAGERLLIVFDQFEEFVILQGFDDAARRREFLDRIHEIKRQQGADLRILFIVRTDYLNRIIQLDIEELISGKNWMDIDPFNRAAARAFLTNSPLHPAEALVERMLDGIEILEDARGLYRAITLNLLGLAAQHFDRQIDVSPSKLIENYLKATLSQVDIREIAPKVVSGLISADGTKVPKRILDLSQEAKVSESEVRLCLAIASAKGLVRPLDEACKLWEISHDFIAKQLGIIIAQLRPSPWPRVALWATPLLFVATMASLLYVVPTYLQEKAMRDLRENDASISGADSGGMKIRLDELFNDTETLNKIVPLARRAGASALDLSSSEIDDLTALRGFPRLKDLDISGSDVTDLSPLQSLGGLTDLTVGDAPISDVEQIRSMHSLRFLSLADTKITTIAPIADLVYLTSFDISRAKSITDFSPIAKLINLKTLYLYQTQFNDMTILINLKQLKILDLSQTGVRDFSLLCGLPSLNNLSLTRSAITDLTFLSCLQSTLSSLDLQGTKIVDLTPLHDMQKLDTLILTDTGVTDLEALKGLTSLKSLFITNTKVRDLSPLRDLPKLGSLYIRGTGISATDPIVVALAARGVSVDIMPKAKKQKH